MFNHVKKNINSSPESDDPTSEFKMKWNRKTQRTSDKLTRRESVVLQKDRRLIHFCDINNFLGKNMAKFLTSNYMYDEEGIRIISVDTPADRSKVLTELVKLFDAMSRRREESQGFTAVSSLMSG